SKVWGYVIPWWREIIPARVSRKGSKCTIPIFPEEISFLDYHRHMIGLTDTQLRIVMSAARLLPVEERDTFLQRRHAGSARWRSLHRYRQSYLCGMCAT
ncbi:MAG: hypothetical protein WBG13_06495, partial [Pseudolabrys sp.]